MPSFFSVRRTRITLFAFIAAIAMLAPFNGSSNTADARGVWCSGDPTIIVNGNIVSVTVHVPLDRMKDLDYVEVIFHVPANANVTLLINDSILVPVKTRFVKDQPAQRGGLLSGTPIPVEIIAYHDGPPMPIAATTVATGWGTKLWTEGTSAAPLWVKTRGLLNLRLF